MTPAATRRNGASGPVTQSEVAVVRALSADAPRWVTAAEVTERTGVSGRTVRRYLHQLCEAKVVLRDGERRGTKYRPAPHRGARASVHRVKQLAALLYPMG